MGEEVNLEQGVMNQETMGVLVEIVLALAVLMSVEVAGALTAAVANVAMAAAAALVTVDLIMPIPGRYHFS